ncbi:MAG: hypothetical protein IPK62_13795 [Bacteroidetes bacterium]|nr:hypothetical protein [Bacteroidota bacterium]MBK8145974.1 hypothetical protein [Bacteroidota bacterium]MBP6313929.1 hypothetical protein [Chitinophagaceae bacterium]
MDNLIDAVKDKYAEISENISSLLNTDVVASLKDYGIEKINEVWTQLENSTEVFGKTGYSITAININVAIPPVITINLDQVENISDEVEEQLLKENKDKAILYPILVALFKANAIQKSINSVQYKFSGISIAMGITPSIEMKFKKI